MENSSKGFQTKEVAKAGAKSETNTTGKRNKSKSEFKNPRINPNQIMPKFYYKAEHLGGGTKYNDFDWVAQMVNLLDATTRSKAVTEYAHLYQQAYAAAELSYQKDEKARVAANTFLRELVEQQFEAGAASIFKAQPSSWEIFAALNYKAEIILQFPDWFQRYMRDALKKKPELILELDNADDKYIVMALEIKPQLIMLIKEPEKNQVMYALQLDETLVKELRLKYPNYFLEGTSDL